MDNPSIVRNIDNTSNRTLASSLVFATINRNSNAQMNLTIELYFQFLYPPPPIEIVEYLCTFYNSNTSQWDESSCSIPVYNTLFRRYECNCNCLTTFALIWSPTHSSSQSSNKPEVYNAEDIGSIVLQAISIACFLSIVIHGIALRFMNPQDYTQPRNLLPLISSGITMLVFIFYIGHCLTIHSRFSQSNSTNHNSGHQEKMTGGNDDGRNVYS